MSKSRFGVVATVLTVAVAVTFLVAGNAEARRKGRGGFGRWKRRSGRRV